MANLLDTLKTQGKATDYNSRKSLYESMGLDKQYGSYSGTASQNIGFQNVLNGGTPSPTQAAGIKTTPAATGSTTTPSAPGQTSPLNGISLSGLSSLQKKYITTAANAPLEGDLYDQYANELGVNQDTDIITGLTKSVMDLEKKISDVESTVSGRAKDFLMTEGQRSRMVNAEQKPLTDQYLEAVRQKNYAEAGLSAKKDLLSTRLKYATDSNSRNLSLLKDVMDFQKSNSSSSDTDWLQKYFDMKNGTSGTSTDYNATADSIFGTGTNVDSINKKADEIFGITPVKDTSAKTKAQSVKKLNGGGGGAG